MFSLTGMATILQFRIFVLASVVLWPMLAAAQDTRRPPEAVNVVKAVRAVDRTVEIELQSAQEFTVRAEITILRIGKKEFTKSRYPADGRLDTLIFTLTLDDFEALPDRAAMTVGYGRQETSPRWNFGQLNKAQLRR